MNKKIKFPNKHGTTANRKKKNLNGKIFSCSSFVILCDGVTA